MSVDLNIKKVEPTEKSKLIKYYKSSPLSEIDKKVILSEANRQKRKGRRVCIVGVAVIAMSGIAFSGGGSILKYVLPYTGDPWSQIKDVVGTFFIIGGSVTTFISTCMLCCCLVDTCRR